MTPRTRALIGINAVAFVWSVGLGAAMPVIPLLSYKFIPDVALAGVVTAIGGVGGVFMGYLSGPLIDRFGTRRISLWGIIIRMVFSFLEGLSRSYVQLAAYRFGSSIGTAIYGTGLSVITAEVSTSRDRGSITGRRSAFAQAGNVLGPLVGAAAWTITNSIRAPFILNGCSKLLCLLIFFFMVREERELPQEEEGAAAQQGALESEWASSEQSTVAPGHLLATIFSTGFFFVVYAIFVESLFRQGITNVVLPVYIRTVLERSQAELGLIISAISLGMVVAYLAGGYIVDRWGIKAGVIPGAAVATVSLLLMGQSGNVNAGIAGLLGIGMGLVVVGAQAYAIDIAPPEARGHFFGIRSATTHVATLVGPLIIGWLTNVFGFRFPFVLLAVMFAAIPLMSLFSVKEVSRSGTGLGS